MFHCDPPEATIVSSQHNDVARIVLTSEYSCLNCHFGLYCTAGRMTTHAKSLASKLKKYIRKLLRKKHITKSENTIMLFGVWRNIHSTEL